MAVDSQIRTRTRSRSHRRSVCHRHPNEPVTGLCALCLRDRLAYLDSSIDQPEVKHENIVSFPLSRRTRGHAGGASSSEAVPELRRSKSVAIEKCEVLNGLSLDLRRKSCDVRACSKLTDLFDVDDTKRGGDRVVKVESKNLGFLSITEPVLEIIEDRDDCSETRISDDLLTRNEVVDDGEIGEQEDLMTMKELIEMELQNKKKNFWGTASIFSQKLRNWRQKHKEKRRNEDDDNNRSKTENVDHKLGRRSCDTAPRFSIDANHMSVEDPPFSLDEHRASWDGYMIARTIPRLTPMLPIVDNMMLPPVNKHLAVKEDGSSSSAKSNSDSYSSITVSSSSSLKSPSSKTINDVHETKLVITERELKNWHSSSVNNNVKSASNALIPNGRNKEMNSRWKKMSNLWSSKYKPTDRKNANCVQENGAFVNRDNEITEIERGNLRVKLVRNSSLVGSRNKTESHSSDLEGGRYSMSDIESGLMRLDLSTFRKPRKSKS